jgi:hypothetical protein
MAAAKRENRQRAMAEKGGVKINLCNVRKWKGGESEEIIEK